MMIELEIQALSERRGGLIVEVGRLAAACGFILQRQRLVQDPNGALLTMVVCGPSRKRRELQAALEGYERIISFELEPFVEGESRPHFAASRPLASYVPPPAAPRPATPASVPAPVPAPAPTPAPASVPEPAPTRTRPAATRAAAPVATPAAAKPVAPVVVVAPVFVDVVPSVPVAPAPESFEELMMSYRRPPAPTSAKFAPAPFVELLALEADAPAVGQALADLAHEYPRILPRLLALDRAVAAGAREASLQLAGQRVGAWLFEREYALDTGLDLGAALDAIGVPALHAFVEVERRGGQLHLRHSPLCAQHGRSGCSFFGGFLEGLLGPAIAPGGLSVFPVCCRSCGADECVFAVSG